MRVIAGTARRTALKAPDGLKTRPTSDRAKESLFNILGRKVQDARFLDLFCGSGAIGIEALSRGAKEVVFVENAKTALSALATNLEKTKLGDKAVVMNMSTDMAIPRLNGRQFDIIFLDPPYGTDLLPRTIEALAKSVLLATGGMIVVETDTKAGADLETADSKTFHIADIRDYGGTRFIFFKTTETDEI